MIDKKESKQQKTLKKIVLFSVLFAFLVIALGAFTRLVDAGLGCPDWPGCYGHILWPSSVDEIKNANAAFPGAPVELDKTWPEMVHRYLATSLGLLSIIILFFSIKNSKQLSITSKLPFVILCVVILQGMFGMWTVTLKLWPQVVTGHLLGGFTTLSLLWLLLQKLNDKRENITQKQKDLLVNVNPLLYVTLFVIIFQIFLGGWTTSNYANVACPDFPTCQNEWWPTMDFVKGFDLNQHIGPNYLGGVLDNSARVAIHMSHRIGAIFVIVFVLLSALKVLRLGIAGLKPKVFSLLGVLGLQVCLGVSNIVFNFPLYVAVAHNLIGALLLLKMISLIYAVHKAEVV